MSNRRRIGKRDLGAKLHSLRFILSENLMRDAVGALSHSLITGRIPENTDTAAALARSCLTQSARFVDEQVHLSNTQDLARARQAARDALAGRSPSFTLDNVGMAVEARMKPIFEAARAIVEDGHKVLEVFGEKGSRHA